jgi:Spy/CpxP family protein refolding chaperone
MEDNKKYKWMSLAIVFLVIMNIATIITVVFNRNQVGNDTLQAAYESGNFPSESASVRNSGRYFRDQLNLTREQMDQFRKFNYEFRQQAHEINLNLNRQRNQMFTEMRSDRSSPDKINLLSDSIGILHADLKKLTYDYYLNFREICNEEQQEKLDLMFRELFINDLPLRQNGRGNQFRRRQGMQFN